MEQRLHELEREMQNEQRSMDREERSRQRGDVSDHLQEVTCAELAVERYSERELQKTSQAHGGDIGDRFFRRFRFRQIQWVIYSDQPQEHSGTGAPWKPQESTKRPSCYESVLRTAVPL